MSRPTLSSARVAVTAIALGLVLLHWWPRAGAADAVRGQLLYENHCLGCHDSVAHIREHREARTEAELVAWVRRWQRAQSLDWSSSEIADVALWLYQRYYAPTSSPTPQPAPGATRSSARAPARPPS